MIEIFRERVVQFLEHVKACEILKYISDQKFYQILQNLKCCKILQSLRAYGIKGIPGNWFNSYLDNRQQYCSLNGEKSKAREIQCGIPQGSCLGPLLFMMYLNDFKRSLEFSKANIYADDTNVTIASSVFRPPPSQTFFNSS